MCGENRLVGAIELNCAFRFYVFVLSCMGALVLSVHT